jgi:tetratricopeptide (TPR) repeat protein
LDVAIARLKEGLSKFEEDMDMHTLCNQAESARAKQKAQRDVTMAFLLQTTDRLLGQKDYDQAILFLDKEATEFRDQPELLALRKRAEEQRTRIKAECDSELARLNVIVSGLLDADKCEQAIALLEPVRKKLGTRADYQALWARAEEQQRKVVTIITSEIPTLWNERRIGAVWEILGSLTASHPETKGLGEAIQQAQEVITKAEALVAQGKHWISCHKYTNAIPCLEQAISVCIDYEPAIASLADARAALRRTAQRRLVSLISAVVLIAAAAAIVAWKLYKVN